MDMISSENVVSLSSKYMWLKRRRNRIKNRNQKAYKAVGRLENVIKSREIFFDTL